MSFKVAISDVLIANEALGMLPAEPIASMNEQSLEGRECRRWYKPVVAELLEKHHWGLATRRIPLAQVSNDRAGEWAFAYATPSDMAFPVGVVSPSGGGYYTGWAAHDGAFWLGGRPLFLQLGGVIYSSVPMGVLEYTSFDITEAAFTNLFKRAVVVELAARICQPITKSGTRTRELLAQAEGERLRIIANDMNRSQPTYGNRPTESEVVRFGVPGVGGRYGTATPIDPVADPIGAAIVPDGAPPGDFIYEG